MSDTTSDPTREPYDRQTALATVLLAREFLREHPPVDWDRDDVTCQEVVADFLKELRVEIVTSEHWRRRLIQLVAAEKR